MRLMLKRPIANIQNRLLSQQVLKLCYQLDVFDNSCIQFLNYVYKKKTFHHHRHFYVYYLFILNKIRKRSQNWTFKILIHGKYQSVKLYCKLINIVFNILSIFCQYFLSTKQNQSSQSYVVGLKMRADYKLHEPLILFFLLCKTKKKFVELLLLPRLLDFTNYQY